MPHELPTAGAYGTDSIKSRFNPAVRRLAALTFAVALVGLWLSLALMKSLYHPFQLQAGLTQPAALTATAEASAPRGQSRPVRLGKIAFVRGGDIWVEDLATGRTRRLTSDGRNTEPLWSPTGRWLAFYKQALELWIIRDTGADAHSLGYMSPGMGQQDAWSPVADRLAYIEDGGLYSVSADGSGRRQLLPSALVQDSGVQALAWSPNGTWIAFERAERSRPPPAPVRSEGIWRIRANGSGLRPVYLSPAPNQAQAHLAEWSPDGRWLLFWRGADWSSSLAADGMPLMRIHALPSGGHGRPSEIVPSMLAHSDFLTWSPRGHRLALVDGGGRETWLNKQIALSTLATKSGRIPPATVSPIGDGRRADIDPAWSPTGRLIAYASDPAPRNARRLTPPVRIMAARRIWVVATAAGVFNGSNRRELTHNPRFRDERPQWSADGRSILFARLTGNRAELWLMRSDGSDQRQIVGRLTPSPGRFGYYGYIQWHQLYDWWKGTAAVHR